MLLINVVQRNRQHGNDPGAVAVNGAMRVFIQGNVCVDIPRSANRQRSPPVTVSSKGKEHGLAAKGGRCMPINLSPVASSYRVGIFI
jgi:hypothetical protein